MESSKIETSLLTKMIHNNYHSWIDFFSYEKTRKEWYGESLRLLISDIVALIQNDAFDDPVTTYIQNAAFDDPVKTYPVTS